MKHTPLPWHFQDEYIRADSENMDDSGNIVADVYVKPSSTHDDIMQANAAFIVRACNSHYEMLAALKGMLSIADRYTGVCLKEIDNARAAIAKAKG
jgi:hypothetical protein